VMSITVLILVFNVDCHFITPTTPNPANTAALLKQALAATSAEGAFVTN